MRNQKLIIGLIIVIAFAGFILLAKTMFLMKKGRKPVPAAVAKGAAAKTPAKKEISKGKGALTVKVLNSKSAEVPMKIRVFKMIDQRSSVYVASTVGGRTQELLPGAYDIEIDTVPQKIFKNVKIDGGRETTENLGCVTGSLIVKTINAKKAPASYPLRILYGKTNDMVTASMTNKALEVVPGIYDIEIGTSPRQHKKDVKIEAGRELIADLGCIIGTLVVKTVDENNKEMRCSIRITKTDTNEIVSSATSNKPIELGKGKYNIDLVTSPRQSKKDVAVNTGEESVVEFTIIAPKGPAPRPQPAKTAPATVKAR